MTQYRFLKEGEVIQATDRYFGAFGGKPPVKTGAVGQTVRQLDEQYRSYGRRIHSKKKLQDVIVPGKDVTISNIAEPVKPAEAPSVQYRFLQEGEIASAKTDEVSIWEKWKKVKGYHGSKLSDCDASGHKFRRPVRIQDATHRYLDGGEMIVSTDEYGPGVWLSTTSAGCRVGEGVAASGGDCYRRVFVAEEKVEPAVKPEAKADSLPAVTVVETKPVTFTHELKLLVAKYKLETGSDTPDYVLAKYLVNCLKAFDGATNARTDWYDTKKVKL
jgi:hypothetical protein